MRSRRDRQYRQARPEDHRHRQGPGRHRRIPPDRGKTGDHPAEHRGYQGPPSRDRSAYALHGIRGDRRHLPGKCPVNSSSIRPGPVTCFGE
ncbi:MAG: hypothetical protein MZU84_06060 [Sphingobacterium sp.]|nr:hypothetical protein [Sphingobacterium sp.]